MLARTNRVVRGDDFRATVRKGRRLGAPHVVVYVNARHTDGPARFGVIVGKNVGNAVTRNLVKRRVRAVSHGLAGSVPGGTDVVVRALPGSGQLPWATLQDEIAGAIDRSVTRP